MNKSKTPIKYLIGVWKTLPGYPTVNDVLYELILHVSKMKGDEFSEQTFNGIWYDASGVANWKGTVYEQHINSLFTEEKYFEKTKEDKNGKTWYKIAHNPWI